MIQTPYRSRAASFGLILLLGISLCLSKPSPAQPTSESPEDSAKAVSKSWADKITLSGALNGEYRWKRLMEGTDRNSGAISDLYIRKVELGIEAAMGGWMSALAVLNSEYLGDEVNQGDETLKVDEVHFDLHLSDSVFYLVVGKKTQPFGVFENYLVTDPMTFGAYSTSVVGATAGYNGPMGLDVSITLYKGTVQMDQLFGAGLFDTVAVERLPGENHLANSCIASATFAPFPKYITVFGAFLSEPSSGPRDESFDIGLAFKTPGFENLLIDGEYIRATKRETYQGFRRPFEEAVLSVSGSYQFVVRPRTLRGSGNYKNRKSFTRAHPFLVAGRFEYFDDDSLSETAGVWSVKNRYSAGVKYAFFEEGDVSFCGMTEYTRTRYRIPADLSTTSSQDNDEVYVRAGVDF